MTDEPIAYTKEGKPLYDNVPTVVAVLAVYEGHLVVVRRGTEPGKGLLALPGGYHMRGESWQEAGSREVKEETGLEFPPHGMVLESLETDEYGNNLVIASNHLCYSDEPPAVQDPDEIVEILLIDDIGDVSEWAFPKHHAAVLKFLIDGDL